jgi:hypothetical protein
MTWIWNQRLWRNTLHTTHRSHHLLQRHVRNDRMRTGLAYGHSGREPVLRLDSLSEWWLLELVP